MHKGGGGGAAASPTAPAAPSSVCSVVLIEDEEEDGQYRPPFCWYKLLRFLGPGVLMSIAYVVRPGLWQGVGRGGLVWGEG